MKNLYWIVEQKVVEKVQNASGNNFLSSVDVHQVLLEMLPLNAAKVRLTTY